MLTSMSVGLTVTKSYYEKHAAAMFLEQGCHHLPVGLPPQRPHHPSPCESIPFYYFKICYKNYMLG